ncbi:MAG: response regulator transcription factor, partial [Solirubrobacterales bacterium]|nr:response regulator transcription factor [Solirubrobacterales bacterium]
DDDWLAEAFEAGANGAVSSTISPVALGTLVRETVNGNVVHLFASSRRRRIAAANDCPLTSRELEVLQLLAAGRTNSEIARQLWVTEQTVKFHLSKIYRKLGVANRTGASHYAHTNGLLEYAAVGA